MKTRLTQIPLPAIRRAAARRGLAGLFLLLPLTGAAEAAVPATLPPALPDVGLSLVRVMGALALVLAIFLGGVWLFRNWQRLVIQRGRAPRLNVIEVRSLGGRHALYVVGYEQERFLISASPAGVHLVSHLEPANAELPGEPNTAKPSFAQALTQTLKGK